MHQVEEYDSVIDFSGLPPPLGSLVEKSKRAKKRDRLKKNKTKREIDLEMNRKEQLGQEQEVRERFREKLKQKRGNENQPNMEDCIAKVLSNPEMVARMAKMIEKNPHIAKMFI
jgi:hypothetical protein